MHDELNLTFFPVDDSEKSWEKVRKESEAFDKDSVRFERLIRDPLTGHCGTVVLEDHYVCKDHRNLHSHFYSKRFRTESADCKRLHFFTAGDLKYGDFVTDKEKIQESYIGFAVLRPIPLCEIGRLQLDPSKIGKGNEDGFYIMTAPFKANLMGVDLAFRAFPHLSQDADATACAHSALWGVCRFLSQRHERYGEFLPYDLISRTSTERGRVVPYRGLTHSDYSRILADFGCHPLTFEVRNRFVAETDELAKKVEKEARADAYSYVESGFPVLASLASQDDMHGHSVNLIGHTIDDKVAKTSSDAEAIIHQIEVKIPGKTAEGKKTVKSKLLPIIDSASFATAFVVSDDNTFPYQLLGKRGTADNYAEHSYDGNGYSVNEISAVVCPLPEKVFLTASRARRSTLGVLKKVLEQYPNKLKSTRTNPLVSRLFVTTGRAFKRRKLENFKNYSKDSLLALPLGLHLPHFLWVLEVSHRDDYFSTDPSMHCRAEIVFDATASEFERGPVYARVANIFSVEESGETRYIERPEVPQNFPRFCHNLGPVE